MTAATSSISIGTDQGIIGLGQDSFLFDLMGDGMTSPVMGVQSTELIHDDKQLLGEPTGRSVDFPDLPACFTSTEKVIDAASFANDISQVYDGNFADISTVLATMSILPRPVMNFISVVASSVSFSDDVVGNIVDTVYCGVSEFNLRSGATSNFWGVISISFKT